MRTRENRIIFWVTWICTGIAILLTVLSIVKSRQPSQGKPYERLTVEEALGFMSFEPDYTVVDVRSEAAFASGHLDSALSLPLERIVEEAEHLIADRESMVYVYGESSEQSCAGAQKLTDMGFSSVAEVGTYEDWLLYEAESETESLLQEALD